MRFVLAILATVLVAYAFGYFLSVPANPEIKFWREVVMMRDRDLARLRDEKPGERAIFFTGGSSTAFSVDPKIIEEACGRPAFNFGLPVAAGAEYLVSEAINRTRHGDLLIVCLEPDLLTGANPEPSPSKFSFAMASAAGNPGHASGGVELGRDLRVSDYLSLSRPGAGYLATFAARLANGKAYRYTLEDIRYRGRIETGVRAAVPVSGHPSRTLSPYGKELLRKTHEAAGRRGVLAAYSMPWQFVVPGALEDSRRANRNLLEQISALMPVLDEPSAGAASEPEWFSDSGQHLSAQGSAVRSLELAGAVHPWLRDSH